MSPGTAVLQNRGLQVVRHQGRPWRAAVPGDNSAMTSPAPERGLFPGRAVPWDRGSPEPLPSGRSTPGRPWRAAVPGDNSAMTTPVPWDRGSPEPLPLGRSTPGRPWRAAVPGDNSAMSTAVPFTAHTKLTRRDTPRAPADPGAGPRRCRTRPDGRSPKRSRDWPDSGRDAHPARPAGWAGRRPPTGG